MKLPKEDRMSDKYIATIVNIKNIEVLCALDWKMKRYIGTLDEVEELKRVDSVKVYRLEEVK